MNDAGILDVREHRNQSYEEYCMSKRRTKASEVFSRQLGDGSCSFGRRARERFERVCRSLVHEKKRDCCYSVKKIHETAKRKESRILDKRRQPTA